MKLFPFQCVCFALWLSSTAIPVYAGVQIGGTRVIYRAQDREATISIANNGDSSRLVQAWVDDGDSSATAQTTTAPFVVTPPISRIDAGNAQTLRIMHTGTDEPQDRERVYWLNVLEIPPRHKARNGDTTNHLQFAVRSRIKIFYRPNGLDSDPATAHKLLTWRAIKKERGVVTMECSNPSPFNVSFNQVALKQPGKETPDSEMTGGGICPARGTERFEVAAPDGLAAEALTLGVINDYGGTQRYDAVLTR